MTNDPKDLHITAAARHARVDLIVTSNLPAFRERDLAPFNLQAIHPDDLLLRLFRADPDARLGILRQQELDGRKPPQTQSEILDGPAVNAPRFVVTIRQRLKAPWQAREIGQSVTAQRCRIRFLNRQSTIAEAPLPTTDRCCHMSVAILPETTRPSCVLRSGIVRRVPSIHRAARRCALHLRFSVS